MDFNILLEKVWSASVRRLAYDWFQIYFFKYNPKRWVNGILGNTLEMMHGVHQESVLGALLLIIYINNLCKSSVFKRSTTFTDDMYMYPPVYVYRRSQFFN